MFPFLLVGVQNFLDEIGQTFQFTPPGKNRVAWIDSPHFDRRPEGSPIDTIVLHHTAGSTTEGCVKWFTMPESRVSSHYVVGKDGSIVQMVSTYDRAWHAGVSQDRDGRTNVNHFSVGIEIVNKGDGSEPYTEDQLEAVEHLVFAIMVRHDIKQIVSHEYIANPQGRKNDPINFPWERMKRFGVPLYYGRRDAK